MNRRYEDEIRERPLCFNRDYPCSFRDVDFLDSGSATSSFGEDVSLMDNVTSFPAKNLHHTYSNQFAKNAEVKMADGDPKDGLRAVIKPPKHPSYTTLKQARRETRLVRVDLARTEATGVVHLNLKVVELDKHVIFGERSWESNNADTCPAYNALSYTWEPQSPFESVYIDGTLKSIGHNLLLFLLQLSRQDSHIKSKTEWWMIDIEWWWIDALSIDQENDAEKSYHLPLMREIFATCDFLFVWLGDNATINKNLTVLASQPPTAEALAAILTAPYFRRLWIVQEFVLPAIADQACERTYFSCASATMNAKALLIYVRTNREDLLDKEWSQGIGTYELTRLFDMREHVSWRGLYQHRAHLSGNAEEDLDLRQMGFISLARMLDSWCTNDCSDLHDKVAGFLGLVASNDHPRIDYTESLLRTFMKCMLAVLNAAPWNHQWKTDATWRLQEHDVRYYHERYNYADALRRLGQEMGLKSMLDKDFFLFIRAVNERAEESARSRIGFGRPFVLRHFWFDALLYCHRCHKFMLKKRGFWYEYFGFLVSFEHNKGFHRDVFLPASGWRAYLPNRQVVLAPDIEKERLYHMELVKNLPHNIDSVTIVEQWENKPRLHGTNRQRC